MITPMAKYRFLLYHADFESFLDDLRDLGLVHIAEKKSLNKAEQDLLIEKQAYQQALLQEMQELSHPQVPAETEVPAEEIADTFQALKRQVAQQKEELLDLNQKAQRWLPWGAMDREQEKLLAQQGCYLHFFRVKTSHWKKLANQDEYLHPIREEAGYIYFVVLRTHPDRPDLAAEAWNLPEESLEQIQEGISGLETDLEHAEARLRDFARKHQIAFKIFLRAEQERGDTQEVRNQTLGVLEDKLRVLEGWIPRPQEGELLAYFQKRAVHFEPIEIQEREPIPVKLQNNFFTRLFEPIAQLYSLPQYGELDLTPYFAPFFMLFFGFCLGDGGYGTIFLLAAMALSWKGAPAMRQTAYLLGFLGLATMGFGLLTGTFFGAKLSEIEALGTWRDYILDNDQVFQLALALGILQILFGLSLKSINLYRQWGWAHALCPIGWTVLILSLLDLYMLEIGTPLTRWTLYLGLGLIVLFNSPKAAWGLRLGAGLWDLYNITGLFGDVLSYIRLFALGVSSAILGFVINDIASQFLEIPYVGWLLFILFLLLGHGLILLIASLGAFVHPMRLTFVEFYKNAGFQGGGKAYRPYGGASKTATNS